MSGPMPESAPDLPLWIGDVAAAWARRTPDRPALVEKSGVWSYRQLEHAVGETRAWLERRGIRPGDRVMIIGENCRALVALILATAGLSAWPVIVSARLSEREIDEIREHCGARRLIYVTTASAQAKPGGSRAAAAIEDVPALGPLLIGALNEAATPEPVERDSAEQVAALIYTSGTTGRPKGVMLTHRNLLFVAEVSGMLRSLTPEDRVYGVLPIAHIVGLTALVLGTLLFGATLYLTPRFDPAAAFAAFERDRLTIMLGVPAMYALLLEYAKLKGLDSIAGRHALRMISTSGAPLIPSIKAEVERLFGITLHHGYGITECSPTISLTLPAHPRSDTSVGPVLPGVEVKVIGADGGQLAPGQAGELCIRGPNVMKGYYRAPEETAAAIDAEGWYRSGDLARLEDGNLFIEGRSRDLIIRFGFNVNPLEVEAVLNAYPGVTQTAVVGRPIAGDEEIVAFVQPAKGRQLTVAELAEHATQNLATYKRPSQIVLVPALPASSTGKVLKSELRRLATDRPPAPPGRG
jgi:long-chain acyl-CoA synthetase